MVNLVKLVQDGIGAWMEWPAATRWISGIGVIWIVSALLPAFHSNNPAAAFGENLAALGIHYGLMLGSIALGILLGPKIETITDRAWVPWAVGIALFFIAAFIRVPLGELFGVSSKLDSLLNTECYVDWDGRSNSTVCE